MVTGGTGKYLGAQGMANITETEIEDTPGLTHYTWTFMLLK